MIVRCENTHPQPVDNQEAYSNAYRASLIEKECVGIYLRKKKQNEVTPTSLLEELDK